MYQWVWGVPRRLHKYFILCEVTCLDVSVIIPQVCEELKGCDFRIANDVNFQCVDVLVFDGSDDLLF